MEFKKLELEDKDSWLKRTVKSKHTRRTFLFGLGGAVAGFLYYYLSEGQMKDSMPVGEIFNSVFIGAFFGIFITNSPCARGRCQS